MSRIFNQRFPTSAVAWSISPEARTSRGDYVDLLIARNTFDPFEAHPTIVYEGKSAHGDPWDKIRSQLWGYAVTYVRRNGQFIYMVGARGTGCRFFRYKKGDLMEWTCMEYKGPTRRVSYLESGHATTYDISTDQAAISCFMDEIRAHPTPL